MPSAAARLTLLATLSFTTLYCLHISLRLRRLRRLSLSLSPNPNPKPSQNPKLLYITQSGTSKTLAHRLHTLLSTINIPFDIINAAEYDPENLVNEKLVVIIASTWEDGNPPKETEFFVNWIEESGSDFRVGKGVMSGCEFGVFGVGSWEYGEERFNRVGRRVREGLIGLGGREVVRFGEGVVGKGELEGEFRRWGERLVKALSGAGDDVVVENGCGGDEGELEEDDGFGEEDGVVEEIVDLEDIAGTGRGRGRIRGWQMG